MLLGDATGDFVPVVGILVLFGLPITYAIISRVLAHQERLEMLRRGIVPPPDPRWAKKAAKHGWYQQTPYPAQPQTAQYPTEAQEYQAGCYLRKGITVAMCGMALLIGLSFIDSGTPGPWLLGGLIPLFVGIAQIIIALLSGARLGSFGFYGMPPNATRPPGAEYQAPQPPPSSVNGPRDVTPGPYAWRPGPTTELEPGPRPPDIKS
jgi:hypothetical protein